MLFRDEDKFDDAHVHIERAKLHTFDNTYRLGHVIELQARVWHRQHRLEETKSEALHAADVYEKIGATKNVEDCRSLFRYIEKGLNSPVASSQPDLELTPFQAQGTER